MNEELSQGQEEAGVWATTRGTLTRLRQLATGVVAVAIALLFGVNAVSASDALAPADFGWPNSIWVDAWAASPQPGAIGIPGFPTAPEFGNQTLRLVVHPHTSGLMVRIRLSNVFGDRPLVIGRATIARRTAGAEIDRFSVRSLTFTGSPTVTIPIGAEIASDPVPFMLVAETDAVVDLYLPQPTGIPTGHLNAQQISYVSTAGNYAGAASLPVQSPIPSWYFLRDVQVMNMWNKTSVITFGDSITDGAGSTFDANHRWPDYLAARLAANPTTSRFAVTNAGIGGGRLLTDRVGPSGVSRFDRDVLSKPAVGYVIVQIGINDIGLPMFTDPNENVTAAQIIQGYQQLIAEAHGRGLAIYAGTLSPVGGSVYDNSINEQKRQDVNLWLRSTVGTSGGFDKLVDFDAVVRDPANPSQLSPAYDSGDHIHLNDDGYAAMAAAAELLFR